jgi:uncharacterized OB-fold protein
MTLGPVARDSRTADFFDGTARGELLLQTCQELHWSEPEAASCSSCGSTELSWAASAGTGRLVTWAVVHGRANEEGVTSTQVVAVVELDEGPWWWTALQDVPEPAEGMLLRVAFTTPESEDTEALPYFVPA